MISPGWWWALLALVCYLLLGSLVPGIVAGALFVVIMASGSAS